MVVYSHQIVGPFTLDPIRLLRAALDKAGDPYELQASPVPMVQDRSLREIAAGNRVDVFRSMISIEREQYLLPVRIPIDRGLFGWRVFHTTEKKSTSYRSSANGRAGLFPRSILEVWKEIALEKHNLRVDPRLSIYYPTALYFFVSKSQPELAKRIEHGLNQMIDSSEFEQLFLEEYGADLAEAIASKRQVIYLENPFLSKETPLERKELWIDPDALLPGKSLEP